MLKIVLIVIAKHSQHISLGSIKLTSFYSPYGQEIRSELKCQQIIYFMYFWTDDASKSVDGNLSKD